MQQIIEELAGSGGVRRFFFFQAEDGIRGLTVTGVQTCALPISEQLEDDALARPPLVRWQDVAETGDLLQPPLEVKEARRAGVALIALHDARPLQAEIGRASCRERV